MTGSACLPVISRGLIGPFVLACLLVLGLLSSACVVVSVACASGADPASRAGADVSCAQCPDDGSHACPAGAGCMPAVSANHVGPVALASPGTSMPVMLAGARELTRDDPPPLPPPIA